MLRPEPWRPGRPPAASLSTRIGGPVQILSVIPLQIPDVKVLRFGRFADARGYFTEHFRRTDFDEHPALPFLRGVQVVQANESLSRPGVVRGLHFQHSPHVGKLVRCLRGRLYDLALDIRPGSPSFGQVVAHELSAAPESPFGEWLYLPPGFAHGVAFPEESTIEYLCTGQYNPAGEACISPLAPDLDWSLCEPSLRAAYRALCERGVILSDKDRAGLTLASWRTDPRAQHFLFGRCCENEVLPQRRAG